MHNNRYKKRKLRFPFFPLVFVAIVLLLSAVVMLLWNAILPRLLHVNTINYGQSVGLLLLCRILFGGFRFGTPNGNRSFGVKNRMREKWMQMSDEDKARFRSEWGKRCRPGGQPPASGEEKKEK